MKRNAKKLTTEKWKFAGRGGCLRSWTLRAGRILAPFGMLILSVLPAQPQEKTPELTNLNIEDLMNIEVTSVSKREQKLSRVASAVFVITPEDIRRSGATNIPDLLRMVPGVQVAQITSSTWAITARGFDGEYSNKLLVLVDGRTVYSPIFSGTFWDAQSVPLENIERIEVIRGPGATVWGANAVNGVINITTKTSAETPGGLVTGGGGTSERGFGMARYGGTIGSKTTYRVFAGGFNYGHSLDPAGQSAEDDWHSTQEGFRLDAAASPKDTLTLEGDVYRGDAGELVDTIVSISPPVNGRLHLSDHFTVWDVESRWNHIASPHSETSLQIYFDHSNRGDTTYAAGVTTFGAEFQHHAEWGNRQDFMWGVGYRLDSTEDNPTLRIAFSPAAQNQHLFSGFVQDEIALQPDRLYLTLGAKLEHNDYTGLGWQPSARIAWSPNGRNMFWAAASRALRTPDEAERSIRATFAAVPGPNNLPLIIGLFGSPNRKDERVESYEAGYRTEVARRVSLDATAFYNVYHGLVSEEPGAPFLETSPPPLHLVAPIVLGNLFHGETHGLELSLNWKVTKRWTLSSGYSFLTMHLHRAATSQDFTGVAATQGGLPNHQAQLRSHVDLASHWQWNTTAFFVGRLDGPGIPSYTRLDSNVVWQPAKGFSISLAGQNLLRAHHLEYIGADQTELSSEIRRTAYAKVTWQF